MGRHGLAAGIAVAVLAGPACVASRTEAPVDLTQPSAGPPAGQPRVCVDSAVRRVCTEITLISSRVLEPGTEADGEGSFSIAPDGRLRYEVVLRDPGNTPGAIRDQYEFVFTEIEGWRRTPSAAPYDLRFLSRRTRYADYEALLDVSGTAENRANVQVKAIIQTTVPATELTQ